MKFAKAFIGLMNNTRFNGVPAFFLQLSTCNLRCVFKNNLCDHVKDNNTVTIKEVKKLIADNPQIKHIYIYGGEPLLFKKELEKLLDEIWDSNFKLIINTNGSLPMLNPLSYKYRVTLYIINDRKPFLPSPGQTVDNIIFGTDEVEHMKQMSENIENIARTIVYGNDFLLYFHYMPEKQIKDVLDRIHEYILTEFKEQPNLFANLHINNHVVISKNRKDANSLSKKNGWIVN